MEPDRVWCITNKSLVTSNLDKQILLIHILSLRKYSLHCIKFYYITLRCVTLRYAHMPANELADDTTWLKPLWSVSSGCVTISRTDVYIYNYLPSTLYINCEQFSKSASHAIITNLFTPILDTTSSTFHTLLGAKSLL